ncbi:MAG: hypothetical protein FWE63_07245 [Bacteroidales bacterium]|nr:hypothetical protein [Bacteroidales bacterium]
MKTNIFKLAAILLILAGGIISCKDKEKEKPFTLKGTKWYLIGIVDVETGDMTELEREGYGLLNPDEFYTIVFDAPQPLRACGASAAGMCSWGEPAADNFFWGRMATNQIGGDYEIDYKIGAFRFTKFDITEAGCMRWCKDEDLYAQNLRQVQSFVIKDTHPRILHLYTNDGKNYLKYKKIGG